MSESSLSNNSQKRNIPFLPYYPCTVGTEVVTAIILLAILLILRFRALGTLSTNFIGGAEGDAGLYIYLLKSNVRDLFSLPWFNTMVFYPYTKSLAWSDNFILPSLFIWPLLKSGLFFPLAYNLLILTASFLNGYLTHRLIFRLSGSHHASLFGGAAFMGYSYLSTHLGHPQLQFAFFIPLAYLALLGFVRSRSSLNSFQLGLVVTAAFLTTVYYSLFIVALVGALLVALLILRPSTFSIADYFRLFLGGAVGVLPLTFFINPYMAVKETFGERGIHEAFYFSATLFSYLSVSTANFLYKNTPFHSGEEQNLSPGIVVLTLTVLALSRLSESKKLKLPFLAFCIPLLVALLFSVHPFNIGFNTQRMVCSIALWISLLAFLFNLFQMAKLERALKISYLTDRALLGVTLFGALFFFALSFGPLGNPAKGDSALGLFRLLYEALPGFDALRAISRAGVVATFLAIVATSLFLAKNIKKTRAVLLIPLLMLLNLLENFNDFIPLGPQQQAPKIFNKIAAISNASDAIIALPLAGELDENKLVKSWSEYAIYNTNYMNWTFPLQRPLVNGYSGIKTKFMREFPKELSNFPDLRSITTLRRIGGLRYVVFIPSLVSGINHAEFDKRLASMSSQLKLIEKDSDGNYLFELAGDIQLSSDFYLLLPSYPASESDVTILSRTKKGSISLLLDDQVPGAALATQEFDSSGAEKTITIKLPQTSESVRPLKITFKSDPPGSFSLRKVVYRSQPSK